MYKALPILFLIILSFVNQAMAQEIPEGVLALQPGGYAFSEKTEDFSAFTEEGITAELWLYLTDIPKYRSERWPILEKSEEYSLAIVGKNLFNGLDDPDGTVYMEGKIRNRNGHGFTTWSGILPEDSPLNNWVHIAFQIKGNVPVSRSIFYNGMRGSIGTLTNDHGFSNTINPLLVGGCPDCESIQGWIGEIRISNGWRYKKGDQINPPMEFQLDEKTIALWHFDEPFGATSWEDSSGNGHTLFAEGTTPVEYKSKLVSTWGKLKLSQE